MQHWQILSALGSALVCFSIAYTFVRVWHDPSSVDQGRWVDYGITLFMMEFLAVHSGGLISAFAYAAGFKAAVVVAIFLVPAELYAAWAFTNQKSRALFWSFAALLGSRFLALALDQSGQAVELMVQRSGVSVLLYVPAIGIATTRLVPCWGMTDPKYADVERGLGSKSIVVVGKFRLIAAAAFYFSAMGVMEIAYLSHVPLD